MLVNILSLLVVVANDAHFAGYEFHVRIWRSEMKKGAI